MLWHRHSQFAYVIGTHTIYFTCGIVCIHRQARMVGPHGPHELKMRQMYCRPPLGTDKPYRVCIFCYKTRAGYTCRPNLQFLSSLAHQYLFLSLHTRIIPFPVPPPPASPFTPVPNVQCTYRRRIKT